MTEYERGLAAGEGGLREALEPLAKLSSDAEWDDVADNARADVVYRSEAGGEESVGTISFADFRRARAALSTSVPAGVVGIKPLEWQEPSKASNGCYVAKTFFGDYYAAQQDALWYAGHEDVSFDWECGHESNTLDAAKAAAQADHDARIRACLITPPAQEEPQRGVRAAKLREPTR